MEVTALKGSSGDVQHFADRIIAGHGVRYGHVAMVPISVKMKRRPKVYLTIETPVVACRFRVKSAVLAGGYPDQRTFLEPVGMSQTCLEAAALRSRLTFRTG